MTTRKVIEQSRTLLAKAMREARDRATDSDVRDAMTREQDRIMKRWWPKSYR